MAEEYGSKAVWFMAGIAIGATVALLYAPATGEDTRRQLTRKALQGPGCAGRFRGRFAGSRARNV